MTRLQISEQVPGSVLQDIEQPKQAEKSVFWHAFFHSNDFKQKVEQAKTIPAAANSAFKIQRWLIEQSLSNKKQTAIQMAAETAGKIPPQQI